MKMPADLSSKQLTFRDTVYGQSMDKRIYVNIEMRQEGTLGASPFDGAYALVSYAYRLADGTVLPTDREGSPYGERKKWWPASEVPDPRFPTATQRVGGWTYWKKEGYIEDYRDASDEGWTPSGRCNNAWIMEYSTAARGYGPLLYTAAMEWFSLDGGPGVAADRHSVSEFAYPVWEAFKRMAEDGKGGVEMEKLPENLWEGCSDQSVQYHGFMAPEPIAIEYSYTKRPPVVLQELMKKGLLMVNRKKVRSMTELLKAYRDTAGQVATLYDDMEFNEDLRRGGNRYLDDSPAGVFRPLETGTPKFGAEEAEFTQADFDDLLAQFNPRRRKRRRRKRA